MKWEEKTHLGGMLAGIGVQHADGSVKWYKELENPVKNRIVSGGLDHMLMYNGSPSGGYSVTTSIGPGETFKVWATAVAGTAVGRSGPLAYCGRGTGNTPTQFTDTALEAQIGSLTSTIKKGVPFCGTKTLDYFGKYALRMSHTHEAETEAVIIKELAWFGRWCRVAGVVNYPMFSRVVLPEDLWVSLDVGESLITTYELRITLDKVDPVIINDFGGAGIKAECRRVVQETLNQSSWNNDTAIYAIPYLTSAGVDWIQIPSNSIMYTSPYCLLPWSVYYSSYSHYSRDGMPYFRASNISFPAQGSPETMSRLPIYVKDVSNSQGITERSYVDYVPGSHYRDIQMAHGHLYPNLNEGEYVDLYYMHWRGLSYRFGYYDTDGVTWIPTPIRKYANRKITFRFRTQLVTDDTV